MQVHATCPPLGSIISAVRTVRVTIAPQLFRASSRRFQSIRHLPLTPPSRWLAPIQRTFIRIYAPLLLPGYCIYVRLAVELEHDREPVPVHPC